MFALAIEYLMGWSMASADGARKQQAEWPPHPDRVFMALAAAWFETGCDEAEGAALRWLEALQPPSLCASACERREPVTHYVPVNDAGASSAKTIAAVVAGPAFALDKAKEAGLALLPEQRSRQPRSFPVALPHNAVVHLCWADDIPPAHRTALRRLSGKVTAVGHSASLVRMGLDDAAPAPNWVPGDGPTGLRLRITGAGRLDDLERRMNKQAVLAYASMQQAVQLSKGKARQQLQQQMVERFPAPPVSLRPQPGLWQGYVAAAAAVPVTDSAHGVFDDRLVVLSLGGQRLNVLSTLRLMQALRGAMLAGCAKPLPPWLSGHEADCSPAREAHVALLPLPFTDGEHADGRLMGVALALPRSVSAAEAARTLDPWLRDADYGLPRELRVFDGAVFDCTAMLDLRERPPATLNVNVWVRPSRRWATVTPIALDRHAPGWEGAAEVIARACERVGLPRPVSVQLHPNSCFPGIPPSHRFAPIERKRDSGRLAHTHAVLGFDREICGPVVLGAGRFRGYGLCKPLSLQG
jgi:CRISPR-associated protein Csb2